MKNLIRICLFLAFATLASVMPVTADPIQQDAEHCVVNTTRDDPLNIRSAPASTARVLAELPYATCGVIVTGACRKVWCPIEDGHFVGWVHRHYMAAVSDLRHCVAPGRRVALMAWPSSRSRILTKLSADRVCELTVLPYRVDGWRKVRAAGWEGWVRLSEDELPEIALTGLPERSTRPEDAGSNKQTADVFGREELRVAASSRPLIWRQPSSHDEKLVLEGPTVDTPNFVERVDGPQGAGMMRGTLLHKLVEEVITRETEEARETLAERARELLAQLQALEVDRAGEAPDPAELSSTTLATLELADVAALRNHLMVESSVWGQREEGVLLAGRADALVVANGTIVGVIDWKSDVSPAPQLKASYAAQLDDYVGATGAVAGVLVFMTTGELIWRGDRERLMSLCR